MSTSKNRFPSDLGPALISRRDFLNGILLASGGLVVSNSIPFRLFAASMKESSCDGEIGGDPRVLRGGNLPAVFKVAHWMRDRRLTFGTDSVQLAPGCDPQEGKFTITEDPERYDVIIAGGGLSGLSTAFYLLRRRPGTRILILDANSTPGGNAGLDDLPPMPVTASTGGSYSVAPYADFQNELYKAVGIEWEKYKIVAPMYNYYFDDRAPGVKKSHRGWNIDSYGEGLKSVPYSPEIIQQLMKARAEFKAWFDEEGAPTDPADSSNPKYDYLSQISLHDYLTQILKLDPIASDFYTRYSIDALAGTAQHVNAHSSISFIGAEYNPLFAFPGGTSGQARALVRWLIPDSFEGKGIDQVLANPLRRETLDRAGQKVRIRTESIVLRVDQESRGKKSEANVIYHRGGQFHRVRAKAVVVAGQSHSARHLIEQLADQKRKDAWKEFHQVPVVVANVVVKSSTPFMDAGCGYNQYWWGSKYWADFVMADWATPNRKKKDRPTVLTFLGSNTAPPEEMPAERFKLLNTPFGEYEKSLKGDLSRVMSGTKFDFDRDVSAIYLYRWGQRRAHPRADSISSTPPDPSPTALLQPRRNPARPALAQTTNMAVKATR